MDTILGAILMVVGLATVTLGVALKARARRQHAWDRVPGTIVQSSIHSFGDAYSSDIKYNYIHKGRPFRGTRLRSILISFNWSGPAARLAERFPADSAVTVYVNPDSSRDAVLEPGGDRWALPFFLFLGGFPLIVGTWLVVRG
jgi:hypothetical protein